MTVTLSYTDYLGATQTQAFDYLYIKGLGTPDKFRMVPPLIYRFPDGTKKSAFKGYRRMITVALVAQTTYESFIQAFIWAAVKTVAYTDPVIGAVTATCVSENKDYEAEWIDEFSLVKRFVLELVESSIITTAWSGQILIDSYSEANQDTNRIVNFYYSCYGLGMGFTGNGSPLVTSKFYIRRSAVDPSCNVVSKLYTHNGSPGIWGTNGYPGTLLATSNNVASSGISTSAHLESFTFASPYTPANGTHYCITIESPTGSGNNGIYVYYKAVKPSGIGNGSESDYGSWTYNSYALCFYCYGSL